MSEHGHNYRKSDGWSIYQRLLRLSLRYWRQLLVAFSGMLVFSATGAAFAWLMKPMLDGSFVERDSATIAWVPLLIIIIMLVRGIGNYLSTFYISNVGRLVIKHLRTSMFAQLLHAPVSYFDAHSSGQLLSRFNYDVEQVAYAATKSITILISDTLTILFLLAVMFYHSWQLTLSFLLVAPLIAGVVAYVSKRFRKISHGIQDSMGDITHITEEMIEGHKVVKIFGGQEYEAGQFERVNEANRIMQMKMVATKAISTPFIQFVVGLALAGIVFLATLNPILTQITVGTFVSFIIAMTMLLTPARRLTMVNETLQKGIAAGQSVFHLLDGEREYDDATAATVRCRGDVEFRDVCFRYDTGKNRVLQNISFQARAGETIALVGRSGSGKSTIVDLLPRFYEIDSGEVLLDGISIRNYGLFELREQITYVGQNVTLFNDSIRNNIAYGLRNRASDAAIWKAAEAAHAIEFIEALPDGMETLIGDNGVLLSGGQRQRLAIARALLKDAPILILDEATSSLDAQSELHIQQALDTLSRDRTTLVVAHRLSTVKNADIILVLNQGRIVESGKHDALIKKQGEYASLYNSQLSKNDPNANVRLFRR